MNTDGLSLRAAAVLGLAALHECIVPRGAETQITDAMRALGSALAADPAAPATVTWPKARDVGRIGDMSPSASMRVGLDNDNDVYVSVWGDEGGASVEFCCPGGGGGQSSRTRMALIALMVAIEADNAETPSRDWWARRMNTTRTGDPS